MVCSCRARGAYTEEVHRHDKALAPAPPFLVKSHAAADTQTEPYAGDRVKSGAPRCVHGVHTYVCSVKQEMERVAVVGSSSSLARRHGRLGDGRGFGLELRRINCVGAARGA